MNGNWVPIVAIVMGIGIGAWNLYLEHQRRRMEYEERRLMIEKGITPPPPVQDQSHRPTSVESSLRQGLISVFLGMGLMLAYLALSLSGAPPGRGFLRFLPVAGPIVLSLGAGHLVYYRVAQRARGKSGETSDPGKPVPPE